MKQEKTPPNKPMRKGPNFARLLYMAYLCICMSVCFAAPASAATIWEKASEIMQDVYTQILTISTIAAIVTASVALLMMNFSRSGRTVEESRAWLKRIIITWVILNGLGFIIQRRPVDAVLTAYGDFRWHCRVDCGTSHAWPGFNQHISFGRTGL